MTFNPRWLALALLPCAMAVPLYFLYELSVVLSHVVHRRQVRRRAAQAAENSIGVPA